MATLFPKLSRSSLVSSLAAVAIGASSACSADVSMELELVAVVVILLFISPVLYLRPQLYSLLFTGMLVYLAETDRPGN